MTRVSLLVVLFVGVTGGCASQGRHVRQAPQPLELKTQSPVQTVVRAVEQTAREQGWQILDSNHRIGIVEAVSRVYLQNKRRVRERWSFFVAPDAVRVWRFLEIASDNHAAGIWTVLRVPTNRNDYSLQKQHLARIGRAIERLHVVATR